MRTTKLITALLLSTSISAQMSYKPASFGTLPENSNAIQFNSGNLPDSLESAGDDDFKKGTVILSVLGGSCMPFGKYAAINPSSSGDISLGFADPGTSFSFNFMVMLAKRFGTTISLSYFDNPVSIDRYVRYMEPHFDLNSVNNYSYSIKTGSWRTNTFMLGIAYKTLNKDVSFELNFKAGLMSSRTPEIVITQSSNTDTSNVFFEHKSEQHFSLGAAPGMQFRFRMFRSLYLNMNSELIFGQFYLDKVHYLDETNRYYDLVIMANFNLQAGLSWEFE